MYVSLIPWEGEGVCGWVGGCGWVWVGWVWVGECGWVCGWVGGWVWGMGGGRWGVGVCS